MIVGFFSGILHRSLYKLLVFFVAKILAATSIKLDRAVSFYSPAIEGPRPPENAIWEPVLGLAGTQEGMVVSIGGWDSFELGSKA